MPYPKLRICARPKSITKKWLTWHLRICEALGMRSAKDSQKAAALAISLLLVANGMTRRDLATALGESEFWLGRRMNSVSEFKITDLERIANLFALTIDGLLAIPDAIPSISEEAAA